MKLKAYPCIEAGGLIWTYMGPPELKPAPPALEWVKVPPERRFVSKRLQESNYLQALEGGIDAVLYNDLPVLQAVVLVAAPRSSTGIGND